MKRIIIILCIIAAGLASLSYRVPDNHLFSDTPVKFVKLYPNPATSYVQFEFQQTIPADYTLQVYNFLGKKYIHTIVNNNTRLRYTLENFYRGIYIYQLRDASGNIVESGKFQVVK
ncbi:MAG: T9SS type A sorting domain-containing protein [Chitinophagaceae bacterium]